MLFEVSLVTLPSGEWGQCSAKNIYHTWHWANQWCSLGCPDMILNCIYWESLRYWTILNVCKLQKKFWVWSQPMRGCVSLWHLFSLVEPLPRMIPVLILQIIHEIKAGICHRLLYGTSCRCNGIVLNSVIESICCECQHGFLHDLNVLIHASSYHKNLEGHTAHTIVSWPNPKQRVIVHTSDLMMIDNKTKYIYSLNHHKGNR